VGICEFMLGVHSAHIHVCASVCFCVYVYLCVEWEGISTMSFILNMGHCEGCLSDVLLCGDDVWVTNGHLSNPALPPHCYWPESAEGSNGQ
jgi:hypothetical protein